MESPQQQLDKGTLPAKAPVDNSGEYGARMDQEGMRRSTIPLVMLALAKDDRYLEHGGKLLDEMMAGWDIPISAAMRNALAKALYYLPLILVSFKRCKGERSRTLGMDACSVDFTDTNGPSKLALGSTALAVLHCAVEYYQKRILVDEAKKINNFDKLKGNSRREQFERQRQGMMDRSSNNKDFSSHEATEKRRTRPPWQQWILQGLIQAFKVSSTTLPGFGGPHMRIRDQTWEVNAQSTVLWLLRLHSAIFLLKGQYPTVLHRLFGLHLKSKKLRQQAAAVNPFDLEYAMGALLAGFSLGALFKITSQALLERLKWSRRNSNISTVPSTLQTTTDNTSSTIKTCMICGGDREHPSCSIHCGHVFCWNCLHKWVQNQSKACPYCRTPCSSKDIVYLYNY